MLGTSSMFFPQAKTVQNGCCLNTEPMNWKTASSPSPHKSAAMSLPHPRLCSGSLDCLATKYWPICYISQVLSWRLVTNRPKLDTQDKGNSGNFHRHTQQWILFTVQSPITWQMQTIWLVCSCRNTVLLQDSHKRRYVAGDRVFVHSTAVIYERKNTVAMDLILCKLSKGGHTKQSIASCLFKSHVE